tara:strand:+ start:13439 stop:13975 length:537 start_codon:yes stop_codon:yes gene_type:complete
MKTLICLLSLFSVMTVQADTTTVYKSVNSKGDVVFSDTPIAGAQNDKQIQIKTQDTTTYNQQQADDRLKSLQNSDASAQGAAESLMEYKQKRESLLLQIKNLQAEVTQAQTAYNIAQKQQKEQAQYYQQDTIPNSDSQNQMVMLSQNALQTKEQLAGLQEQLNTSRQQLRDLELKNNP